MGECKQCGQCCHYIHLGIELGDGMKELVSAHYGRDVTRLTLHLNHPCSKRDPSGNCTIYESRPRLCREFECNGNMQLNIQPDDVMVM